MKQKVKADKTSVQSDKHLEKLNEPSVQSGKRLEKPNESSVQSGKRLQKPNESSVQSGKHLEKLNESSGQAHRTEEKLNQLPKQAYRLRGRGLNFQALTECLCYLLFAWLLFWLTFSGQYLNYVTPRMKPYLYGMSALMLLWAGLSGRHLLMPRYRARLARSLVLALPMMLLAVRPPALGGSSMVKTYAKADFSIGTKTIGAQRARDFRQQSGAQGGEPKPAQADAGSVSRGDYGAAGSDVPAADAVGGSYGAAGSDVLGGGAAGGNYGADTVTPGAYGADGTSVEAYGADGTSAGAYGAGDTSMDAGQGTAGAESGGTDTAGDSAQSDPGDSPWYQLRGLDKENKIITIADEDYYTWIYELSHEYEKYKGFTVVAKGFVYRDAEVQKRHSFALIRLSMWCCAADLTPIGFLVDSDSEVKFKNDEWVTVRGSFSTSPDEYGGENLILKLESVEAAAEPREAYVYPYFS